MAFSNAQHSNIYGSMFMDIGRDHYNIGGDQYNISKSEPGLLPLFNVTSPGAAFDSNERYPPARCHPGTRKEIIEKITHFVPVNRESGEDLRRVLWLQGPAGAGKSAIAQTIAEECAERKTLAASFFFSRGRQGRDTIDRVFTTIAYQLAMSIPSLRSALRQILFDDPSIVQKNIFVQLQKLVIEPLQALFSSSPDIPSNPTPSLVIIDGLDECAGTGHQDQLLNHILTLVRTPCVPLRFLIVSRQESNIRRVFEKTDLSRFYTRPISLYGDYRSHKDVRKYLLHEFNRVYTSDAHEPWMVSVPDPWPATADVDLLAGRCDGYFIYASTLVKFIDQPFTSPLKQLDIVLNSTPPGSDAFGELDKLYHQILSTIPNRDAAVLETVLRAVLAGIPTDLIGHFFLLETGQVLITLRGLQSVLRVSQSSADSYNDRHVPIHTSFRDFLFDPARAGRFHIDPSDFHAQLTRLMLDCLRKCSQATQASRLDSTPGRILSAALYSYKHWVDHFMRAGSHRTALVKEVMAMDNNCWIPLPPETDHIPWHDEKFSSLKTLCAGGIAMLLSLGEGISNAKSRAASGIQLLQNETNFESVLLQEDLIQFRHKFIRLREMVICRVLAPKCLQDQWILCIFIEDYHINYAAGLGWFSAVGDFFGPRSTLEGGMVIQGLFPLERPFSYHTLQIYEFLNALSTRGSSRFGPLCELRHYFASEDAPPEVFLDRNTSHAHLAHQCMELLTADVDKIMGLENYSEYHYSRFYWANHLTNAPSGEEKLLRCLQSIDRQHLLDGEYFNSTLTYLKKLEEGVQVPPKGYHDETQEKEVIEEHDRVTLSKLSKFCYRIPWEDYSAVTFLNRPLGETVKAIRRGFLFNDLWNVHRVKRWLKEGPQSPDREDLVRQWEAYHEELQARVEPRHQEYWKKMCDEDNERYKSRLAQFNTHQIGRPIPH